MSKTPPPLKKTAGALNFLDTSTTEALPRFISLFKKESFFFLSLLFSSQLAFNNRSTTVITATATGPTS
jgi:hypothetical protein